MKGSFVERVREYLRRHLGACPPTDLWRWVDDVMRVRQVIVERCGRVDTLPPREQREIMQLTHRRNGLELVADQGLRDFLSLPGTHSEVVLRVRPDFCLEAVTAARGLFGYLYQSRRWSGGYDVGTEQH